MKQTYVIVIEGQPGEYSGYIPDLPGVIGAGDSIAEVVALLAGAAQEHVDLLGERGQPIPAAETIAAAIHVELHEQTRRAS